MTIERFRCASPWAVMCGQAIAMLLSAGPARCQTDLKARVQEIRTLRYDGSRRVVLDSMAVAADRIAAMQAMVMTDAVRARNVLAVAMDAEDRSVRRAAVDWLATYGDSRALAVLTQCIAGPCSAPHQAARLLGNAVAVSGADALRETVDRLRKANYTDGMWRENAEERALLEYSILALARMGKREDRALVLGVIESRVHSELEPLELESLGYVDDPMARQLLWSAYEKLRRQASCDEPGLGVTALLPLSRLGEPTAIRKLGEILEGIGTPADEYHGMPTLCGDREQAFRGLKPRDARAFAEVVLGVATREPETRATIAAWESLGVMHPAWLGEQLLRLALSKRPGWKMVDRDLLNKATLAIDPALNDRFWLGFDLEFRPAMASEKLLVEAGLGRLLFRGTYYWTGD